MLVSPISSRRISHILHTTFGGAAMRTKSRVIVQRPPADFEEVKRRFVRQNRELAKNNSNQSLRIRSLEIEVSRLLADNLELREKVLGLEHELYAARTQVSGDAVRKVKEELRRKIEELSGVVDGLDAAVAQKEDGDARVMPRGKKPIEGQWRERQPLTEVMRESQMPTIVEDKTYPRRTLGADEMQAIRLSDHSSNESPDLGPPPIAHFDYEDPMKHASPSLTRTSPKAAEEEVLPGLSVNLETRRKRKDGQPKLEIRRHSILPQSPEKKEGEGSTMLRTGAKRKLADRDLERATKPAAKDDFSFSRRGVSTETKTAAEQTAIITSKPDIEISAETGADGVAAPPKHARKVLGDKSVNMSPRKTTSRSSKPPKDDPAKPEKPHGPRSASATGRSQSRTRRISSLPLPSPPHNNTLPTIELPPPPEPATAIEPPPKTPAPPPDLFSPTPSEPSANPTESRAGTPPPGDLSMLSTSTAGGGDGNRPSRRARAAVNYAEPSLVAKMRRPSKQYVDALSGLQDPRSAMCITGERKVAGSGGASRTVVIKQEPLDDEEECEAWKSLPAAGLDSVLRGGSPLGQKSAAGDRSSDALVVLSNEEGPEPEQRAGAAPPPSAASATISALMAGSSRSKRRDPDPTQQPLSINDINAAIKGLEDLDIYDFKDSSSSPATSASAIEGSSSTGKATTALMGQERSHRRHSSVPKDVPPAPPTVAMEGRSGAASAVAAAAVVGRSERAASRRRSMML